MLLPRLLTPKACPKSLMPLLQMSRRYCSSSSGGDTLDLVLGREHVNQLCAELYQDKDKYGFAPPLTRKREAAWFAEKELSGAASTHNAELLPLIHSLVKVGDDQDLPKKCVELFNQWAGKSKLAIGYLLYANKNLESDEFITRLVKHMSQRLFDLMREELVALMLMIYFRRHWEQDEILQFLDCTGLQKRLANLMEQKLFTNPEICAIILGLKKISGFAPYHPDLRYYLYETLYDLGHSQDEFTSVDQMLVVQVCTLLTRKNLVIRDDRKIVRMTMEAFLKSQDRLDLATAVKIMSYGVVLDIEVPELTRNVSVRIATQYEQLNFRDLKSILNFFARIGSADTNTLSTVLKRLDDVRLLNNDAVSSWQDLSDYVQCLADLTFVGNYYSVAGAGRIFQVANSRLKRLEERDLGAQVAEVLMCELFNRTLRTPCPKELAYRLVRNLCILNGNIHLSELNSVEEEKMKLLEKSLSDALLLYIHNSLHAGGEARRKAKEHHIHEIKADLDKALGGGQGYCALVKLLPHYLEPDLVFGCVASTRITVPSELNTEDCLKVKRAPEVGTWFVIPNPKNRLACKRQQLRTLGFKVVNLWNLAAGKKVSRYGTNGETTPQRGLYSQSDILADAVQKILAGLPCEELEEDS